MKEWKTSLIVYRILKLFWYVFQRIKRWSIELISAEWKIIMIWRILCIIFYLFALMRLLTMLYFYRYDAFINQHSKLLYDDTQYLLTLIFADKTFWDIDLSKNFWQLQISFNDSELLLRWTEFVKCLSILRNATMQQNVSKESLSKKTFDCIIKSVLNFLRYFDNATVYAIRRYFDKKINNQSS